MYENNDLYLLKNDSVGKTFNHFLQKMYAVSEYLAIAMTAIVRGVARTQSLARQIIPKSCSFSPETDFDFKSHFSYLHPVVSTLKSHPLLGNGLGR